MSNYSTYTATYTVVDIRKTFESFEADLRMIARRTDKWEQSYVVDVCHDILKYAEAKYLKSVDITLMNQYRSVIQASRYTVSLDGKTMNGDRAGGNNWPNLQGGDLTVILQFNDSWYNLTEYQRQNFQKENGFKVSWSPNSIDTTYSHLSANSAQTYGSKGYELKRINYQ